MFRAIGFRVIGFRFRVSGANDNDFTRLHMM